MRGDPFHNQLAREVRNRLERFGWQVSMERRMQADGITTYVDLYAAKNGHRLACEIETTARHALENAKKANTVGMPLWIVVPTRRVKCRIAHKLDASGLTCCGSEHIKVLLLGDLETELARCQAGWKFNSG